jgi:arylsulfatase A-like enzyme
MKSTRARGSIFLLCSIFIALNCVPQQNLKPNIIFFFIDDMGWQDTSVPFYKEKTKLNETYYTPNMERMAKEGMKFTQAYACAVCSPSRISLMTGMNAARHQVTNWTLRKDTSPDPKHKEIEPPDWNMNGLSEELGINRTINAVTLPRILQEEGYRTIHVGKAHFGAAGTPGEDPLNLGFDVNIGGHAAGGPGSYYGKYNFSAKWRNGDGIWDIPGLESYHGKDIYLTEALTIEANKEIDKAVKDDTPFYLYMSHYAIHAPWEEDDRYVQKYIDDGLSEFNAAYASMIEGMDKSLGDIIRNVDRLGISDNTFIVFMSDNGQPKQAERNRPLRGHKLTPYEGGIRVPLIVKWPGTIDPGINPKDYIIIEDIFPTFLAIAGVDYTSRVSQQIDGKSFVPLLKGQENLNNERPIYWHFPHTYDQPPYSAVRKGDWKLVYHHMDQNFELFNLDHDISERENLLKTEEFKAHELAVILSDFLRETNAGMPTYKNSGKSVPYPDDVLK